MTYSIMAWALVAFLVQSALAHDCPCECLRQDGEQQTVQVVIPEWQRVAEPVKPVRTYIPVWQYIPPTPPTMPPSYAPIQEVFVGSDGILKITLGEATPSFIIDRVLNEEGIEIEWLASLTCAELDRVEDALYARHKVDFEDPTDEAFFAAATVGVYRPVFNLTREDAEYYFSSVDSLTKLFVKMAQANANCSN